MRAREISVQPVVDVAARYNAIPTEPSMTSAGSQTTTRERAEALLDSDEYRVDGREKVSGRAKYTADLSRPNMLWAAYAISPIPHGRIVRLDVAAAKAVPGVRAVLTGADIGPHRFGRILQDWPVLAYDKVRFTGQRVAAVAAETRDAADEAARLIDVTYEDLPSVFDSAAALADGAPILHHDDESDGYAYLGGKRPPRSHANLQGELHHRKGDENLEPIFASAARVFEHVFTTPRQHHGYIEPRATLVWIDPDGLIHVHSPNKSPFRLRQQLATALGVAAERFVIEPSYIGGDFGGKGLTLDEAACYFLARATGRPVKSVLRYVDELQGTCTRHPGEIRLKTAVDRDGTFLAHHAVATYNGGAYAAGKPNPFLLPGGQGFSAIGYQVPNVLIDVYCVYTNTAPGGNMRSPTDVQCGFAWELHIDMMARELGVDPLEFRIRNAMREGDTTMTGTHVHGPNAIDVLETLKREVRWDEPLPAGHGRGIGFNVRETGIGKTGPSSRSRLTGSCGSLSACPIRGPGRRP